eukprot:6800996-Alexandrium_andersonii.AAC.1
MSEPYTATTGRRTRGTTQAMEAGTPPQTFEEWVAAIARGGRWIDGAASGSRSWWWSPAATTCASTPSAASTRRP